MEKRDFFRQENHSCKYSKRISTEVGRKKRTVKHSSKVNVWNCFSSQSFGARIVGFKRNFNVELMCDIYKRGLSPTARKQFDLDSTIWELLEDNDAKHKWKVVLNWKASGRIEKMDWSSMSSDLASIENVWQPGKMKLRKKKFDKLSIFDLGNKRGMEGLWHRTWLLHSYTV